MKTLFLSIIATLVISITAYGQTDPGKYKVFTGNGAPSSIEAILTAAGNVDVVFLGEQHDDAVAHSLQLEIFKGIIGKYTSTRRIALSYEMFERDVQLIVDEYLKGQISESQFLASSRPWNNYKTDYRPLLELAKEKGLPVVAANAPRRYVNMVSRLGRSSLDGLSAEAKKWLPPLPYPQPSDAYAAKFRALMGDGPEMKAGLINILDSQTLWDSGMAYAITRRLEQTDKGMVVHLNGSFHSEGRMGTAEKLANYRKKTEFLVVTIRYEDDFQNFNQASHKGLGDFVILTDKKIPRSFTR